MQHQCQKASVESSFNKATIGEKEDILPQKEEADGEGSEPDGKVLAIVLCCI